MNEKIKIEDPLADLSLYYWTQDNLVEVGLTKKEDCYLNINKEQATEIVDFLIKVFKIKVK